MKKRLAELLVIVMLCMSVFAFADDALTATQELTIPEEEIAEKITEPEEVTEEEIPEPEDEAAEEEISEPDGEAAEEEITEPDGEAAEEEIPEPDGEATEEEISEPEGEVSEEESAEPEDEIIEEEITEPEVTEKAPMLLTALGKTACEHKNVFVYDETDYEHGEYYNKTFHTCKIYTETFCRDCHTVIESVDTGKVVLSEHGHGQTGWDGSGYCEVCGYQCPHENKRVELWSLGDESYEPLNEKEHICSYDADFKTVTCNDCWTVFEANLIEQTRVSKVLEHYFDDNGVCEECGYKSTCKHEHLVSPDSDYNKFEPMDENYHWCDYQHNYSYSEDAHEYYAYCLDCKMAVKNGAIVGYGSMEHGDNYWDEHHFVNGVCKECGYVKGQPTCDHEQYGYNSVIDESIAPKYVNITETTHCVQHTIKLYCKNCGEYVKSVLEENPEPVPHTFVDNTCVCGCKKGLEITSPTDGATITCGEAVTVRWKAVDGADHYDFAARYTDEAQQFVAQQSVGSALEYTVPANLIKAGKQICFWVGAVDTKGNRICVKQIYVNTDVCKHPNVEDWRFIANEDRYESNAKGHRKTEVTHYEIHCGVCGADISDYEVAFTPTQEFEAHTVREWTSPYNPIFRYERNDESTHKVIQKQKLVGNCAFCGYPVEKEETISTTYEKHTSADGCSMCGYKASKLIINDEAIIDGNGRMKIKNKGATIKPHYYLEAGTVAGDSKILENIIRQFDVMNNYQPVGNTTYCNFYAGNVARAMGAFLPGANDTICQNCYGLVNISNDYNGWGEIAKENNLYCTCGNRKAVSVPFNVYARDNWEQVGKGVASDGNYYGDLTRWFIEKSSDFGWEAINQDTADNYSKITDSTEKLSSSTIDQAIKYANEGYLVVAVRSDWIVTNSSGISGHAFIVYPNSDTTQLYTAQAGGKSTMRENATNKGSRSSDNPWIIYYVYKGI